MHGRAPGFHHRPAIWLLLVRDLDHVYGHLEAEQRARKRQRGAPLAGPGLGRQPLHALFGVVVRLRNGGVGFVRAGRRYSLVLEVDVGGGVKRLLESLGAIERARPPDAVDVPYLLWDFDPRLGGNLLRDDGLREDRREIRRSHRLQRLRIQVGKRRRRKVGQDVVPALGDIALAEQDLLDHAAPPESPLQRSSPKGRPLSIASDGPPAPVTAPRAFADQLQAGTWTVGAA